jgi:AcrR family transcriptional regulator
MARPRTKDDAEVLDAVGRILGRRGLAWTLADVAAEAGLSPATIVQRFGSKHGVVVAFARHATAGVAATVRAAATGGGAGGAMSALLAMAAGIEDPDELTNHTAMLHADLADPELRAITRASLNDVAAVLAELVGEDAARALLTAYNGSLITWAVHREGPLADWLRRDLEAVLSARTGAATSP